MTTSLDLTKRALAEIGTKTQITALDNTTPEGRYASILYNPLRDFLLRKGDYDFSITQLTSVPIANPSLPWVFGYQWPTGALRIREAIPLVFDPLNPIPVEFTSKFGTAIFSKVAISSFIFTQVVSEDFWDPEFAETFVRMLGSALAFALENRIEASREKLQEALAFATMAESRDG